MAHITAFTRGGKRRGGDAKQNLCVFGCTVCEAHFVGLNEIRGRLLLLNFFFILAINEKLYAKLKIRGKVPIRLDFFQWNYCKLIYQKLHLNQNLNPIFARSSQHSLSPSLSHHLSLTDMHTHTHTLSLSLSVTPLPSLSLSPYQEK